MKVEIDEKDLQKIKGVDDTGFTWRERLAIFFLLKVVIWLSDGTSLHNSDISLLKNDIEEGLKIHRR